MVAIGIAGRSDDAVRVALWRRFSGDARYLAAIRRLDAFREVPPWLPGKSRGVLVYDPADGRLIEQSALVERLLEP